MTREELSAFLGAQKYGTVATVAEDGSPAAAVVGYAVSDALELVFDTLSSTRKLANLAREPRVAFMVWEGERTAQLEGVADVPSGSELERLKALYFARFPDGVARESWPGLAYVRVRPRWARFSDFGASPPRIEEMRGSPFL